MEEKDISPESLNLVSAVYLGPINIFEEQMGDHVLMKTFERYRQHRQGTFFEIVKLAEEVANENCVSYFTVNVVRTKGKDRTWTFKLKEDTPFKLKENTLKGYFLTSVLEKESDKPKKPEEFVLHPTAQLYMLRE